jgi:hypothetical protein
MCIAGVAKTTTTNESWDLLIRAISTVESTNNERAVNGKHVGILQISPVLVSECNRISKEKKFKLSDRYNKEKSIEMFNIYQSFYNPERSIEKAIRLWNGGPNYRVSSTNGYYRKVMKALRKLKG